MEGYTDVISMHQAGIKNVVSSSGTAFDRGSSETHQTLQPERNSPVLMETQLVRELPLEVLTMLLEGGLNVRAVSFPEGEDPDSYSKQLGTTAFQHFVTAEAQDFIQFKTNLLLDEIKHDPIKKSEVIKDIVNTISKIEDSVKRAVYLKECSDLLDIQESVLIREQNKLLLENRKKDVKQPPPIELIQLRVPEPEIELPPLDQMISFQEKESIRLLLNYANMTIKVDEEERYLIDYFLREVETTEFRHLLFTTPFSKPIMDHYDRGGEILDANYFLEKEDEVRDTVIDLCTNRHEISNNWSDKYHIHVPTETEQLKNLTYTNILRLKFRVIQQLIDDEYKKVARRHGGCRCCIGRTPGFKRNGSSDSRNIG